MAQKKGGGSTRNGRDSQPKMLGVKAFGGETISAGSIIVRQHSGNHSCAGHQGSADFQVAAVSDSEHLVDHDFLAYVRSNLFYFNFFAGGNAILLAAGFYDRVHVRPLK